jgi:hypothetical protein
MDPTVAAELFYWRRLHVTPGTTNTIRAKVWADGSPEPSSWMVSVTVASLLLANLVGTGANRDQSGTGENIQCTCSAYTPSGRASPCGP